MGLVSKKRLPFYEKWAARFLQFCKAQPGYSDPKNHIEPFLMQLGRAPEQWRFEQATAMIDPPKSLILARGDQRGLI